MSQRKNSNLTKAKSAKNDEFYTQMTNIEKEVKNYREHFNGKTVFCNCDDPEWSSFWRYFELNFDYLGLKKLISTHYDPLQSTYKMERTGMSDADVVRTDLLSNGDFRSDECTAILKEADIVVTNPPFSLFREYMAHLMEHQKKFLIIGNVNSVTYKSVFPLIKENRLWIGTAPMRGMQFRKQDGEMASVLACWFTNLTHPKRTHNLELYKEYAGHENDYPHYDDYDAIDVGKVANIPRDYMGAMGVPITFLDKFNPDQFELLDCVEPCIDIQTLRQNPKFIEYKSRQKTSNGKLCQKTYHRLIIKRK